MHCSIEASPGHCTATKNAGYRLSHALSPTDTRHYTAWLRAQQIHLGTGGHTKYVWVGHSEAPALARQMVASQRICKLAKSSRRAGRPLLRVMKSGDIDPAGWKAVSGYRSRWIEAIEKSTQLDEKMRQRINGRRRGLSDANDRWMDPRHNSHCPSRQKESMTVSIDTLILNKRKWKTR